MLIWYFSHDYQPGYFYASPKAAMRDNPELENWQQLSDDTWTATVKMRHGAGGGMVFLYARELIQ